MKLAYGVLAAAYVAAFLAPNAARAHAVLMRSEPAAAAVVPRGPLKIVLQYNSRIDFGRSVVKLNGPGTAGTTLLLTRQAANVALADADPAAPGAYTIRWQVLATDGHITRGIVPFVVVATPVAADTTRK